MPLILGIESSCDETAAAVVRDGTRVLSNVVSSQIATHQLYGGVVPELAAREHLRAIVPVVREAVNRAGLTFQDIDAFAATQGPGLAGALLVGITYAKTLAFALSKPLISVNHLEGHIHAVLLEQRERGYEQPSLPALALVVSGGHTHLYLVNHAPGAGWTYKNVGRTLDDAAGEAFDKVAKLLGLGYPGGPLVEALAVHGNAHAVVFPPSQIKVVQKRHARGEQAEIDQNFDFSFSGIKTAVLRYVETHAMQTSIEECRRGIHSIANPTADDYRANSDKSTLDLLASFQESVVHDLVGKTLKAAGAFLVQSVIVTGGVAANGRLRAEFERRGARVGVQAFFPSRKLSTDNAAMIAAAAYPKFVSGDFADAHFCAEASLALGR
jgi:N6-L-threonylcarbamoyladenine synthase